MGAALEGSINQIPSVGFSHISYKSDIDFDAAKHYARLIAAKILENGLKKNTCLNVNFPNAKMEKIKGVKTCRQTMGYWREEFDKRVDPIGKEYFWLTGEYFNDEPDAQDTDEWALKNNYISIVPVQTDLTNYESLQQISQWDL